MWVFPGGRVEDADGDEERDADEDDDARRAAVREAAEETGLVLDDADLVPFAHWVPPDGGTASGSRRGSSSPRCPTGAADVVVDGGEIGDHVWTTPAAALERHAAGEVELAPPTWVTLHSLRRRRRRRATRSSGPAGEPVAFYATHIGLERRRARRAVGARRRLRHRRPRSSPAPATGSHDRRRRWPFEQT